MRRLVRTITTTAGVTIALLTASATAVNAIQIIPGAAGIVDDGSGPLNANASRNPLVGSAHWPRQPFLNVDAVPTGNNTVVAHGSCGSWDPDPGNPRGTVTPIALDGGHVRTVPLVAGGGGGTTVYSSTFGSTFEAVTADADVNRYLAPVAVGQPLLKSRSAVLYGEYPHGTLRGPIDGVPQIASSNPAWAFLAGPSSMGLTYAVPTVIGADQLGPSHLSDVINDTVGRATLHPDPADPAGPATVVYGGVVEYMVYSDSFGSGPIDFDRAPINADGSFDVRLNTAGLGPDTYVIRLLGCSDLAATLLERRHNYRINYYQGLPNNASAIFTNYNTAASLQNDPRVTSYVPTATPGSGISVPQQTPVGADIYTCWYPRTTLGLVGDFGPPTAVAIIADSLVGNAVTGVSPNIEVAAAGAIFGTLFLPVGANVASVRAASNQGQLGLVSNLVTWSLPQDGGYGRFFVRAIPQVVGRGPNEVGVNGTFQLAGPISVGSVSVYPSGAASHFADNLACGDAMVHLPYSVLPASSGYNGNTDFSCGNRYNNVQALAGAIFGGLSAGRFGVIGGISGAPTPGGLPTGGIDGGFGCPSAYNPFGLRANSNLDYFGRFRVF